MKENKMQNGEVKFTYSSVLRKNNRNAISVRFEREYPERKDYAEGWIPECKIEQQEGFTAEEIEQMEEYLKKEKHNIIEGARELNNIKNWF